MSKARKQESDTKNTNSYIVPWIVFLFSISIVLISFISVIFPALIFVSDTVIIPGVNPITPDPYELGVWSGGVILANIIIFTLAILHFKNKLPEFLSSLFKKIFSFEISKKYAFAILTVLMIIYVAASAGELSKEETLKDYQGVKERLESWSPNQMVNFEPHVKYFFLKSSMILFGNYKVIPLLTSLSLLITTYFLTKTITNKRFAGIISVIVLMQSSVFLTYDTSVTYDNLWILFYLVSLYTVFKLWPLSPVSYLLSIPSKALTVAFLPMSIYFILRCKISKKQKMLTSGITIGIILIGGIVLLAGSSSESTQEEFNSKEFWMGFASFASQLRFDGLVILFLIPLIVGLFIAARNGIKHGESIMIFIVGMLVIAPILTGFTNQTNQPYRFVPLVVFFAIGVGVLLSKRQVE